jgi:uncharacterized protein YqeY
VSEPQPPGAWRGAAEPDPSYRAVEQLREAISNLRELVETRLDAGDIAVKLVAERLDAIPEASERQRQHLHQEVSAEIQALRELLESRLSAMDKATELLAATVGRVPSDTDKAVGALRELLSARIDGMDTATKLLADTVAKLPSDVDRAVASATTIMDARLQNVQAVMLEKFDAVGGTFASNALALTAALAAQKEAAAESVKSSTLAIDRANAATKETIAANAAQTTSAIGSQAATIADLKDRVVRLESGGVATVAAHAEERADRGESRLNQGQLIAFAVLMVAVLSLVLLYATKK